MSQLPICNVSDLCCIFRVVELTSECGCQVLCNHSFFEVIPSYSSFPGINDYKRIMERYNISSEEEIRNNLLKVHVFYKELTIEKELTVRSYSLTGLIADIGGQMGLFLGASIISLTEFLTLIFDQVKDRLFGIRERRLKKAVDSYWAGLKKNSGNKAFTNSVDLVMSDHDLNTFSTDYKKNGKVKSNTLHVSQNDSENDGDLNLTNTM